MNSIWELTDENGISIKGQDQLKCLAKKYFGGIFKKDGLCCLEAHIKTVRLFPSLFN